MSQIAEDFVLQEVRGQFGTWQSRNRDGGGCMWMPLL